MEEGVVKRACTEVMQRESGKLDLQQYADDLAGKIGLVGECTPTQACPFPRPIKDLGHRFFCPLHGWRILENGAARYALARLTIDRLLQSVKQAA